jgi:hypothetical protein
MHDFIRGAIVMASATIGLFFLRFWRRTHDRLFLFFAVTFWLLGADWLALTLAPHDDAHPHTWLFLLRLTAFVVLLVGIWDKNRRPT